MQKQVAKFLQDNTRAGVQAPATKWVGGSIGSFSPIIT